MTLMPVSNIVARGSSWSNERRVAVDLPVVLDLADVVGVEGLAEDVEHVAEDGLADRHRDAAAGLAHDGAAHEAVGRLHAHAPDAALADLLGHLAGDVTLLAVELEVHLHGVVDLRQGVGRELHVDDGAR